MAEKGLLKGKTVGIDATTLEANAAMRSIVRQDTGEGYEEFLSEGIVIYNRKTVDNSDCAQNSPLRHRDY